jgi:hypothetical protein
MTGQLRTAAHAEEQSSERLLGSKQGLAAMRNHSKNVSEPGRTRSANLGTVGYSE